LTFKVSKSGLVQGKEVEPSNSRSRLAHKWPIPVGSLVASLVVGTILTLTNHGSTLFPGELGLSLAWVIRLTYLASFVLVVVSGPLATPYGEDQSGATGRGKAEQRTQQGEGL